MKLQMLVNLNDASLRCFASDSSFASLLLQSMDQIAGMRGLPPSSVSILAASSESLRLLIYKFVTTVTDPR